MMIGQMINWLNGATRTATITRGATRQFSNVMPLVEHVDCYEEICVLQRYPSDGKGVGAKPLKTSI